MFLDLIDRPQNIRESDIKFLRSLNVSEEVISITKQVVLHSTMDDIDFITVDGLLYYYDADDDPNKLRIADARTYYADKDYLDVNVIDQFEKDFGYRIPSDVHLLFEFHKKEKLKKLINKL